MWRIDKLQGRIQIKNRRVVEGGLILLTTMKIMLDRLADQAATVVEVDAELSSLHDRCRVQNAYIISR